ncbi:terminase large subunit [Mycobacterium phage Tortellini]|uniref:Terminase large subunit n=1 Tax=Mycobacterium phage Tortellini TaxID=1897497 RepID=A0A1D8EX30_9CAUD|nr:terminase large subunit [Mycobacterium phage Tortellini]AOT25747.1 terminase large subunit [Mycobacterium phage Tortellini]
MTTTTRPSATRRTESRRLPSRSPERPQWPEWVGSWPRLRGRQMPEFESKHEGDESSQADRCGRFGLDVGLRPMPWQWRSIRAITSVQPPTEEELEDAEREGREPVSLWTHRDVCIECTRQQGKTLLIVLLILFHMFVLRSGRIIYTAQRWSTAYDVFKRVVAVINRVPWLRSRLAEKPSKAGNRGSIKLHDPKNPGVIYCEAEFGPRSQDFGRGYTEIDLLIIDEAYDIDPEEEANLTGAQSAAKNPQTIYISTAPVAAVHPKCHTLAGLHRLGHNRASDLYYALYAAPRDMPRDSPETWALAQPSYGVATNEREIRSKQQKAKTVEQRAIFDADYLGWGDYPPDEDEIGSPFEAVWDTLAKTDVELVGSRAIAVHRSRNRKRWVICAAQYGSDFREHIEVGPLRTGSHTEVARYLISKVAEWNPVALVIDRKNGAAVLEPLLLAAGIEPTMTGTSEMAHACGGFLDAALDGSLTHSDQEILNDAILSATMRELPGGDFAWLEDDNGVAIPLVGVSLAHWALRKFGQKPKAKTVSPRTGATRATARTKTDQFDAMTAAF